MQVSELCLFALLALAVVQCHPHFIKADFYNPFLEYRRHYAFDPNAYLEHKTFHLVKGFKPYGDGYKIYNTQEYGFPYKPYDEHHLQDGKKYKSSEHHEKTKVVSHYDDHLNHFKTFDKYESHKLNLEKFKHDLEDKTGYDLEDKFKHGLDNKFKHAFEDKHEFDGLKHEDDDKFKYGPDYKVKQEHVEKFHYGPDVKFKDIHEYKYEIPGKFKQGYDEVFKQGQDGKFKYEYSEHGLKHDHHGNPLEYKDYKKHVDYGLDEDIKPYAQYDVGLKVKSPVYDVKGLK